MYNFMNFSLYWFLIKVYYLRISFRYNTHVNTNLSLPLFISYISFMTLDLLGPFLSIFIRKLKDFERKKIFSF